MEPVFKRLLLCALLLMLAGCASMKQFDNGDFQSMAPGQRVLVMPPDIALGVLNVRGEFEPNVEWSEEALALVQQAVETQFQPRVGSTEFAWSTSREPATQALVDSLVALHKAVGMTIYEHNLVAALPAKTGPLEWTMGEKATLLGAQTGYDYALFISAIDTFRSPGSTAVNAGVALLTCRGSPVCVIFIGSRQLAYASLVDLKTSRVVWFGRHYAERGDMRSPENTNDIMARVLGPLVAEATK